MKKLILLMAQGCLIGLIYQLAAFLVQYFHLPLPASVLGMVLLFGLLMFKVIKVEYVDEAAHFFNKHLSFFFIPFAVGLMNYGGLIHSSGVKILVVVTGSTLIGLIVTARVTQFLAGSKKGRAEVQHGNSHSL